MDSDAIETPTEQFITQAGKRLRGLSTEHRDAVLAEALSHVVERTAELIAVGMDIGQAETTAVAAFGKPERWARDIDRASYADAHTDKARILAIVAGSFAVLAPQAIWLDKVPNADIPFVLLAPLLVVVIASFRARQYLWKSLGSMALVSTLIGFIGMGLMYASVPRYGGVETRASLRATASADNRLAVALQQRIDLLHLGIRTFGGQHTGTYVPITLRNGGRYVMPVKPSTMNYTVSAQDAVKDRAPYLTAGSLQEAEQAWSEHGGWWLHSLQGRQSYYKDESASLRHAADVSTFDCYAGLCVACTIPTMLTVILIQLGAASAGCAVFRIRRRRRSLAA